VDDSANGCKQTAPYRFNWTLRSAPAGSLAQFSGATVAGASAQAAPSFVPDLAGDYTFQLTVTDALGLQSAPATRTLTISPCNAPLSAAITAPAGAVTGQPLQLHAAPSDPNLVPACPLVTQLLSYSWSLLGQPGGGVAQLNSTSDAAPSFTPALAGRYTVQLIVTDSAGNQSPAAVASVDVAACTLPLTVSIPDASGATGQPLLLAATVIDPNAACAVTAPLRYRWTLTGAPAGSAVRLNNPGAAAPSFVPDLAGSYLISLVVLDAAGNSSAPATGNAKVADCTAVPTVAIAGAVGVTGLPVALLATVTDTNSGGACTAPIAPYAYAWSLIARPSGSAAALNDPAAVSPSLTPDAAGTYSVSLRVTDAAGNRSAPQTADITVANCRAQVLVSIVPQAGVKTFATVALAATLTDLQDASCAATAPVSYAWSLTSVPAGSTAALDLPSSSAPHFVPNVPGDYVATLQVTDALGNRGAAASTVVVMGCGSSGGSSLQLAASAATGSPEVGQRTALAAVVSDSNSTACANQATAPYAYAWSLAVPAGSNAVLANANSAQPAFVPDVKGAYGFTVTVTDALGYRASAGGSLTALDCTLSPAISAVGANQLTFSQVQLVGAGASACAQPFTYAWSFDSIPAGSSARFNDPAARTPSFPVDVPLGTWVARLTLTDAITGAQASTTRTITSGSCGSSMPYATAGISLPFPISVSIPQPDPNTGSTAQYLPNYQLQLDGTLSADPSAACTGPLSFAWTTYSTPANSTAVLYPATAAKPVFTPDLAGDYIFQLRVSDGRFTTAPSFLHITVSDPLGDAVAGVSRGVLWNDAEPDPLTSMPSIAFFQKSAAGPFYDLNFARCTGGCATGSPTWVLSTIETKAVDINNSNRDTAQVSLKFLPGTSTPAVAYRYDSSCEMHYAVFSGAAWNISRIDALDAGCSGEHGEIQLMFVGASNTPAVAYHTHINGGNPAARYAACTAGCATGVNSAWAKQDVDTNGNAGHYMTAFVSPVSKLPRLAYQDDVTRSLHYAECSGSCAAGTGTWASIVVIAGSGNGVGFWNSMSVAPNGVTGVAFENGNSNKVQLSTCASACTAAANWSTVDIATLNAGNYFPSLQYDPQNHAHVTYIDSANQVLRYAIQSGNSFQYFDIDHGVDDGHSSFILTPLGSTHVSYALSTGLKYYPFGD
jgi:PKD repeat protein